MICDSWRWARSEEHPPTPCLLFSPVLKADFDLSTLSPPLFYSPLLLLSVGVGLDSSSPSLYFFHVTPQRDRQTG